jgi:hypothetical protein
VMKLDRLIRLDHLEHVTEGGCTFLHTLCESASNPAEFKEMFDILTSK